MKECCIKNPVYTLTGGEKLCKKHFITYFEKKVRKTIRIEKLIGKKEKIGVAVSGGKDSLVCLYLLNKILRNNRNVEVIAITLDMGIKGYGDRLFKRVKNFCERYGIKLYTYSIKDEINITLDKAVKGLKDKPCTICGVLRRQLLNRRCRDLRLTKIATGHNLDDEAQSILMNQFRKNIGSLARLGPKSGMIKSSKFVQRIKPLYFCTEEENMLYARLMDITKRSEKCPYKKHAFRKDVGLIIDKMEKKYSGVKNNIVRSFLEIRPILKREYSKGNIKECRSCKEPTSKDLCNNCLLLEKIKKI